MTGRPFTLPALLSAPYPSLPNAVNVGTLVTGNDPQLLTFQLNPAAENQPAVTVSSVPAGTTGQFLTQQDTGPQWKALSSNIVLIESPASTYTVSTGTLYIKVELIGGGGGGSAPASVNGEGGRGGGGGGYWCSTLTRADNSLSDAPYTVSIGIGGSGGSSGGGAGTSGTNTTFLHPTLGTFTADGGTGASTTAVGTGGSGSPQSSERIVISGQNGGQRSSNASTGVGGSGGSSGKLFGAGGQSVVIGDGGAQNGSNGLLYGGGGGGGISAGGAVSGGNGANGCIIITEFIAN